MPQPIISVENLGKRYRIRHEKQERYTTLRDTLDLIFAALDFAADKHRDQRRNLRAPGGSFLHTGAYAR